MFWDWRVLGTTRKKNKNTHIKANKKPKNHQTKKEMNNKTQTNNNHKKYKNNLHKQSIWMNENSNRWNIKQCRPTIVQHKSIISPSTLEMNIQLRICSAIYIWFQVKMLLIDSDFDSTISMNINLLDLGQYWYTEIYYPFEYVTCEWIVF